MVFPCVSHEGVVSNSDLSARLRIQKAFPSGDGGLQVMLRITWVDEEVTFLKSQTLPKKSSKALLSAGL